MKDRTVCPYYGCDEEVCDVGCGYISPHDAKMIIKYCSAQFTDCLKYHELADRLGEQIPAAARSGNSLEPLAPNHTTLPAPAFGLFCFGMTAALFAFKQLPVPQLEIHILSLLMVFGALGQILTGVTALRINPLRAVAFTAFGLFWLSLLAVELLPAAGYGQRPGAMAQAGYLVMWGMFSLILAQGAENLARTCRLVFALLTVFLLLLALAQFTGSITLLHAAAVVGIACSLPALVFGIRQGYQEVLRLFSPQRAQAQRVH